MAGQLGFYGISDIVEQVCSTLSARFVSPPATVEEALAIDEEARRAARARVPHRIATAP
jgi:1-deoxy-D-xylulose-5-phosphate reductoisomerase